MSSGRRWVQENRRWFAFHFFEESHVVGKAVGSGNSVRDKFLGKNQVLVCMQECNHRSLIDVRTYIVMHIYAHTAGVWTPASYRFACTCISCIGLRSPRIHIYTYTSLRRIVYHCAIYIYKHWNNPSLPQYMEHSTSGHLVHEHMYNWCRCSLLCGRRCMLACGMPSEIRSWTRWWVLSSPGGTRG